MVCNLLINIFNRLARSCLYGAQNVCEGHLPAQRPDKEAVDACVHATLDFERACFGFDAHGALAVAESLCRGANKRWSDESKAAKGDDDAYAHALANAFCALRTTTLLMHAATPSGCERICDYLGFERKLFFRWEHALKTPYELAAVIGQRPEEHALRELPPHFDFFTKGGSQ